MSGPRIYNLFPPLIGSVGQWKEHLPRIARMRFNWVFLNPFHLPGFSGSLCNDLLQAFKGIGAVAFLGPEALGLDDEHALRSHAFACNPDQAFLYFQGQGCTAGDIEPELDCGCDLVDVLAAGPA
jgi:hypothetical protein